MRQTNITTLTSFGEHPSERPSILRDFKSEMQCSDTREIFSATSAQLIMIFPAFAILGANPVGLAVGLGCALLIAIGCATTLKEWAHASEDDQEAMSKSGNNALLLQSASFLLIAAMALVAVTPVGACVSALVAICCVASICSNHELETIQMAPLGPVDIR